MCSALWQILVSGKGRASSRAPAVHLLLAEDWRTIGATCSNWHRAILAPHLSAPGNGGVLQAFHRVSLTMKKRQCFLGAGRAWVMTPLTSPWPSRRSLCAFDVTGNCVVCVCLAPLTESNSNSSINNNTQMSAQTLCSRSCPRIFHLPRH